MKITAESTEKVITLEGKPIQARVWEAETEGGIRCHLWVTRVMVAEDADQSEFEKELSKHAVPSKEIQAIPLRMVL